MELHASSSSTPLSSPPPHPVPSSSSTPLFSPPLPSPPPTSDGVVGGCEVGQCVEVPQEDAVLQTTADGHLSLGGVSQSFDVVLVCPQCGSALPRLGVPQLQSGVRGGREDWSHKSEMVAQLQSPPLPQHTHSLFLPPWQRAMSLTQSVWCSMARTYLGRWGEGRGGGGGGEKTEEGKEGRGGEERVTSENVCVCVSVCAPLCCR